MNIAVIGMGKIGLPLAVQYAKKGNSVTGVDVNSRTVALINQGLEPFPGEAHLNEYLTDVVSKGMLRATLDYSEAINHADVIVVVVPLFVNGKAEPDFVEMDKATALIGSNIKKGALICFETTLPIGTTRNRFVPSLERNSGLKVGINFNVVFSPERVLTGRIFEDLRKYPKIVGGITKTCAEKGVNFYEKVLDFDIRNDLSKPNGVWELESTESAEFVKLAETTYRDLNIALANQFAMYAAKIGVNIYSVIESSNSQNFSHIHQPGISVGGHCIPVYPYFYLNQDKSAKIIQEARDINEGMPNYFVELLSKLLPNLKNKTILISGIAYRAGVKEVYNSGIFSLTNLLEKKGSIVYCEDNLFSASEIHDLNLKTLEIPESEIDIYILHTENDLNSNLTQRNFKSDCLVISPKDIFTGIGTDISVLLYENFVNRKI